MSKRGSGSSARKSSFGNISIGGGYKTSQETLDIAKMEYESNMKVKDTPDWMAKEYLLQQIKNRGGENPQKWVEDNLKERATGIRKDWEKRTKKAKKFPYKTKEEWQESVKPNGKGRSEAEVTTSTYERARKRAGRNFDRWFGRGMGK